MNEALIYHGWRPERPHRPDFMGRTPEPYPATRFFDQLCFIGDPGVACFLLETREGLVLLDCMNPDQRSMEIIETGIRRLGHKPEELTAILITHGHGDHWGMAGQFRERYGCRLYMSRTDYEFAAHLPDTFPWAPLDYPMDGYLEDMGRYTFGDTTITTVHTPGHTAGCMSFIIPVTDEGRPHAVALWGGTGILPDTDPDVYLGSLEKFRAVCDGLGVDGEIATHPFVDNTICRLELINHIVDGVPNPFVIGVEGRHYYEDMFRALAERAKIVPPSFPG